MLNRPPFSLTPLISSRLRHFSAKLSVSSRQYDAPLKCAGPDEGSCGVNQWNRPDKIAPSSAGLWSKRWRCRVARPCTPCQPRWILNFDGRSARVMCVVILGSLIEIDRVSPTPRRHTVPSLISGRTTHEAADMKLMTIRSRRCRNQLNADAVSQASSSNYADVKIKHLHTFTKKQFRREEVKWVKRNYSTVTFCDQRHILLSRIRIYSRMRARHWYSHSISPSVRPSVSDTPVLCQNG